MSIDLSIADKLLTYSNEDPVEMTYVGIGSAPRYEDPALMTAELDQILPSFILDILFVGSAHAQTVRCYHFDPHFELDVIKKYIEYKDMGFTYDAFEEKNNIYTFRTQNLELIFVKEFFEHKPNPFALVSKKMDDEFLEALCEITLLHKKHLVVQEFTGHSIQGLFKELYAKSYERNEFKNRILFDITYNTDWGCCVNMAKYKPIYKKDGHFFNFTLASEAELQKFVGTHIKIDAFIGIYFKREYKNTLNNYCVDYRRKLLRNEPPLFLKPEDGVDETTSPDAIMALLIKKLRFYLPILKSVRVIDDFKIQYATDLMATYRDHDPYKWYDQMDKLVAENTNHK
jgi:hypothetical protein